MRATETNPIEVSVRDAREAFQIIDDMGVTFFPDGTNVYIVPDPDEWNAVMEAFEEQGIELL